MYSHASRIVRSMPPSFVGTGGMTFLERYAGGNMVGYIRMTELALLQRKLPRDEYTPINLRRRRAAGEAQEHRFEADPVVTARENFVACDVLSQLQRVMDNPRFLLTGECEPLSAGRRVRIYASRGPYVCIYPQDTITPCKWTHKKVLSK